MRIGATVLLYEQQCIQSYGWSVFRPFGKLQGILDSLEEYQCDEVAIIRPVRKCDNLERFKQDVNVLQSLKSMTPISFGGGIRSIEHLNCLRVLPIERLVFSSAFINKDKCLITAAIDLFGHQAIQCILPLCFRNGLLCVYESATSEYVPIEQLDCSFIDFYANEIVLIDIVNEGRSNSFNWELLDALPFANNKLVISGGIGSDCIKHARENLLASVLIDNKILHSEFSISSLKHA
jgi:cyclase